MAITYNKNLNSLLNLLINCISARSAPQILLIKVECTFLLLHFLIIGFYNSSANSLFEMLSFLIANLFYVAKAADQESIEAPPEVFSSKNL